ncbi:MAG TPA: hypothetical protein VHL77_08980 [Ferruginibacter sp.]|nr:hypothetical protein [Ferruginibacter sp.]
MKKKILIGLFLVLAGISTTFANSGEENVNAQIINSFKKDFTGATNVQWSNGKDFTKATFTLNEHVVYAYYSDKGDLLGVTRNIVPGQLPMNLLNDVKRNYNQYWIADLFEIASNNETTYYITLETSEQKLVLKSAGTNGWETFKKEKKETIQ